ncbi:MAG: DUF3871 family protein [Prolixibacteraceae bacterium]|nr:DUF3871 family protein [Prolixibacteraceae bacterium]
MELVKVNKKTQLQTFHFRPTGDRETSDIHFLAANTVPMDVEEMRKKHTIPVFAKDNESFISHQEFIETVSYITEQIFGGEQILKPAVRVSHPIKGRIPSAVGKPAKELMEHEKTLYFERMAFAIEIASIRDNVAGNELNLTVGGVRVDKTEHADPLKRINFFNLHPGLRA